MKLKPLSIYSVIPSVHSFSVSLKPIEAILLYCSVLKISLLSCSDLRSWLQPHLITKHGNQDAHQGQHANHWAITNRIKPSKPRKEPSVTYIHGKRHFIFPFQDQHCWIVRVQDPERDLHHRKSALQRSDKSSAIPKRKRKSISKTIKSR